MIPGIGLPQFRELLISETTGSAGGGTPKSFIFKYRAKRVINLQVKCSCVTMTYTAWQCKFLKRGVAMPVKVGLQFIEGWKESMEDEVLAYEKEPVVKGQIVCYGPSNFTRWSAKWGNTPISEMLPGKSGKPCVINRASDPAVRSITCTTTAEWSGLWSRRCWFMPVQETALHRDIPMRSFGNWLSGS